MTSYIVTKNYALMSKKWQKSHLLLLFLKKEQFHISAVLHQAQNNKSIN